MTTDILVVGGGIIGAAITYELTKRGVRVTLLEKNYFAQGASGSCDQGILLQSKVPGDHLRLGMYSMELYKDLSRELDAELEFTQKGYLVLIETPEELETMREVVRKQNEAGLPSQLIGVEEAVSLQPGLNRDAIVGAAFCPLDGEVNPYLTTLAYADRAARMGADIRCGCPVVDLIREGERIVGARTPGETIYAHTVINAAGAWAGAIGEMAGLSVPIKPRRGQVYITEAVPTFVHKGCINARYIVAKHHPELLRNDASPKAKLGVGLSLTQSHKGNVLFGATREFEGFDTGNSVEGLRQVLDNAVHLVPGLKDLNIIRTMGGLRPWSPDSKPLIGYVKGREGFFMAAGHEGDGISLAPATGKLVADLITEGKTEVPAAQSFDVNRFDLLRR